MSESRRHKKDAAHVKRIVPLIREPLRSVKLLRKSCGTVGHGCLQRCETQLKEAIRELERWRDHRKNYEESYILSARD